MTSSPTILNKRFSSLDLLRGLGIWMIVLYHVYKNIFLPNPYSSFVYRSLYFTTGYFVFSVGLVLAIHYFPKIVADTSERIFYRLFIRSLKLILIVVVANIISLSISVNTSSAVLLNGLEKIITILYTDRWDISYQVLLPISVTLGIGYFLIIFLWRAPKITSYGTLALVIVASIFYKNDIPYLWRFTAYGLIGILCGHYYICCMHNTSYRYLPLLCVVLFITFLSISFFAVYGNYYYYIINNLPFGVISSCSYTFSLFLFLENIMHFKISNKHSFLIINYLIHVGKNSLFYYITQGFFCIIIARYFHTSSDIIPFLVSLFVLGSCSLLYWVTKLFRNFRRVDTAYNYIFQ